MAAGAGLSVLCVLLDFLKRGEFVLSLSLFASSAIASIGCSASGALSFGFGAVFLRFLRFSLRSGGSDSSWCCGIGGEGVGPFCGPFGVL